MINRAVDLLESGESAIVIYTDGRDFERFEDGSGSTAYWAIDPKKPFTAVVVYHVVNRNDKAKRRNDVYTAIPGVVSGPYRLPGLAMDRYVIQLSNVKAVDATLSSWSEFAQTGSNPIRYVTR